MLLPPRRQRNNERKLIQLNKDGEDIHNKDDQDIQITPNNASILWVDRHLRHRTAETHTTTRGEGAKRRTTHDENPATQQQQLMEMGNYEIYFLFKKRSFRSFIHLK